MHAGSVDEVVLRDAFDAAAGRYLMNGIKPVDSLGNKGGSIPSARATTLHLLERARVFDCGMSSYS